MEIIKHGYEEINLNTEESNALRIVKRLLESLPDDSIQCVDYEDYVDISPEEIGNALELISKMLDYDLQTYES